MLPGVRVENGNWENRSLEIDREHRVKYSHFRGEKGGCGGIAGGGNPWDPSPPFSANWDQKGKDGAYWLRPHSRH